MQAFPQVTAAHRATSLPKTLRRPGRPRLRASSVATALALATLSQLASADVCSFSSGYYSGGSCPTTVASGDTLGIDPGGYKYLDLTLNTASGSFVDLSDHLYFAAGNTINNAGSVRFLNDSSLYDNGASGVFINTGTLSKVGGTGDSTIGITGFVNNGGTINAQTGRIVFNNGATFNAGSAFTGPGQVLITNGANFSGSFSSDGSLVLTGGSYTGNSGTPATLASGSMQWASGTLAGSWQTGAGTTVNIVGGGYKYMGASLSNGGTLSATDHVYFNSGMTLTNNGSYQFANDSSLYDSGGTGNFINNGTLAKIGGGGDSHIAVSGFVNNAGGVIDVQTGRMLFDNGANFASGSSITGVGQVLITNGATFNGALSTANNLYLVGGTITANNVVATGDVFWTSGTMAGSWQNASGSTLHIDGGGYKYVGGTLTNAGTMTASDHLYFNDGSTLVNNGSYQFSNDSSLYNSGGAGNFVNNGTLAKVGGGGDSRVSVSGFINSSGGIIDVQTGRMVFDTGAVLSSGSIVTGAGQMLVTNGATINGALSTANNLTLSGGTITANNVTSTGDVHLSNGTMSGQWSSASGSALYVDGGGYKYAAGLTLAGRTVATDHLYAYGASALTNNGRYEFANDSSIYGGGDLINNSSIVKTGGGGTSDLSGMALQNLGTLEAQTGTLRLPDNFTNVGKLMGMATMQVNGTLSNNGHIAPGAADATGTLTLAGNLIQGALGTLDIRLASSSLSDMLLVSGTAGIDGSTLALSCFSCLLQNGDAFLLMSSSGALTGTFASVTTSGFGDGFQYTLDYSHANQVWLDVTQVGAVPEPSSYAILLAGLGVVAWVARRRKTRG